jgi:hypothetical protein
LELLTLARHKTLHYYLTTDPCSSLAIQPYIQQVDERNVFENCDYELVDVARDSNTAAYTTTAPHIADSSLDAFSPWLVAVALVAGRIRAAGQS